MATPEREFYRNAWRANPTDQDAWQLVYDQKTRRLFVRHEWQGGNGGAKEYILNEFVAAQAVAADAGRTPVQAVARLCRRARSRFDR